MDWPFEPGVVVAKLLVTASDGHVEIPDGFVNDGLLVVSGSRDYID